MKKYETLTWVLRLFNKAPEPGKERKTEAWLSETLRRHINHNLRKLNLPLEEG